MLGRPRGVDSGNPGAPRRLLASSLLATLAFFAACNGEITDSSPAGNSAPVTPGGNAGGGGGGTTDAGSPVGSHPDGGTPDGGAADGGTADGGTPDGGSPQAPDPLDAAPTCTSNTFWTQGTHKSPDMEPGHACISCHGQQGGPRFSVAGTVYPSGHEPDDCDGSPAGGAVVTVTDARGATATFTASTVSGNFHGSTALTFPITAKVTFNGKTRAMATAVSTGDCNSCHTQTGSSAAPGRITLPP